jgi:hypothetical protein
VKSSKAEIRAAFHKIPRLCFQTGQKLTSYAGLVIFQALFAKIALKDRLRRCVSAGRKHLIYGPASCLMTVLLLLLLGFRRLRELDYCREDPMLARILGLRRLPDVSTVSRHLARMTQDELSALREQCIREPVLERLETEGFARVTLDFDGLVQSTCGHAEGTAIGYNRRRKGARSYYPQFCTVAQTGQFFDILHRPGNVHDSNGADEFMGACFYQVGQRLPGVKLESRFDAAMFSEVVFLTMEEHEVEFTGSVPFARFPVLKRLIEEREHWCAIDATWSYFETSWKPKCWDEPYRVILVRKRRPVRRRGPLQLDLFVPLDHEYEYTAIATNKTTTARNVVEFHHGRGSQEKLFGEANQHAALNVVAGKRLHTNQAFTLMGMLAHNLSRELQMAAQRPQRPTLPSRAARWVFLSLGTLRQRFLHRAGKLTRPQGELTLTMNANPDVEAELRRFLDALAGAQ